MLTNQILKHFNINGQIKNIRPIHGGNIHKSYLVQTYKDDVLTSYLLQKVNSTVFKHPHLIGQNIQIINDCLHQAEYQFESLQIILTKQGELGFRGNKETYWRVFSYIEHTSSFSTAISSDMAFIVSSAFGYFSRNIQSINFNNIHTSIPDFHNLKKRLVDFRNSIHRNKVQRLKYCQKEVNWLQNHVHLVHQFTTLELPIRLVHADAKIGNVLFDMKTHQVKAIIDWDTIMPSSILFDFGDLVRSMACNCDENERDLSKIYFDTNYLFAIKSGFYEHWANSLVKVEREHLILAAKVLIIVQSIRFLTDYLEGDLYYQTQYEEHNWRRAQNQITLAQSFIQQIPN